MAAATPLDDLIAGARTAERPHHDVDFTLDAAVAKKVEEIDLKLEQLEQEQVTLAVQAETDLAEASRDARLGDPRAGEITAGLEAASAKLQEQIDALTAERDQVTEGALVTARFTMIPGQAWAEICARSPERPGVLIDQIYHYNYHEVAQQAAMYRDRGPTPGTFGRGYADRVLPADGDTEPEVVPISPEQWAGIFEVISGHEFESLASAIWDLNAYGPEQRIAAAGKASRAGSSSRSSSPARSESAPAASPDGSPADA